MSFVCNSVEFGKFGNLRESILFRIKNPSFVLNQSISMMSHQSQGWTAATEDALSTCSDNSNSEMINPQRRPVNSETLPLRFRNVGSLIPIPAGRKAMVTALGFTLVVITTIVGVTLYTTGSSSGHELEKSGN